MRPGTALSGAASRAAGWGVGEALLVLIRLYRATIARALPPACRFEPSCSAYAEEALRAHRLPRAVGLVLRRLLRCHPFHPGGFDPVP